MSKRAAELISALADSKSSGRKIAALTAYDYPTARIEEECGVDFILVGDSMAMAVLGEETTLTADLEVLLVHTRAVRKGAPDSLIVGDMPYGSYEESDFQAVQTATRFVSEGGADAVKLEGGSPMSASRVRAIIAEDIPVMGHIGLLPQSIAQTGGYRVVRSDQRDRLLAEARALEEEGIFALIIEGTEEQLAREVTESVSIPTIGIGAGRYVDGQILVVNDMLGMSREFSPRFVKRYADLAEAIGRAVSSYAEEVRNGVFPEERHTYKPRGDK